MTSVIVRLKPGPFAVIVGVIELLLSELARACVDRGGAWRRRRVLELEKRLRIRAAARSRRRTTLLLTVLLVLLFVLTIIAELSIEGQLIRSPSLTKQKCFQTKRTTRYLVGYAAQMAEITDARIAKYINETTCKDKLLKLTITGPDALEKAYPACENGFDTPKRVHYAMEVFGCGIGFVANSGLGDYHCDFLPVGEWRNNQSTSASTSFYGVFEGPNQVSRSFLKFNYDSNQRYMLNVRIPYGWRLNTTRYKHNIPCKDITQKCFDEAGRILRATTQWDIVERKNVTPGVLVTSRPGKNSSLCIFSDMSSTSRWVNITQALPGADERQNRYGPALVSFDIEGTARCVHGLHHSVARMYFDAMEMSVVLGKDPLSRLKAAAVAAGMRVATGFEKCDAHPIVQGSSVNVVAMTLLIVYSLILLIISIAAAAYSVWAWKICSAREDPLTPMWAIREILRERGDTARDTSIQDVWVGVDSEDGAEAFFSVHASSAFDTLPRTGLRFRQR